MNFFKLPIILCSFLGIGCFDSDACSVNQHLGPVNQVNGSFQCANCGGFLGHMGPPPGHHMGPPPGHHMGPPPGHHMGPPPCFYCQGATRGPGREIQCPNRAEGLSCLPHPDPQGLARVGQMPPPGDLPHS